jgi:hypothetical protein
LTSIHTLDGYSRKFFKSILVRGVGFGVGCLIGEPFVRNWMLRDEEGKPTCSNTLLMHVSNPQAIVESKYCYHEPAKATDPMAFIRALLLLR